MTMEPQLNSLRVDNYMLFVFLYGVYLHTKKLKSHLHINKGRVFFHHGKLFANSATILFWPE